jgi:hypothetical protein
MVTSLQAFGIDIIVAKDRNCPATLESTMEKNE